MHIDDINVQLDKPVENKDVCKKEK